jgi:hypothetical protein
VVFVRGFASFLAYIFGVSAVIGLGIAGLMALRSPTQQMPPTPLVAVTSNKKPLAPSVKQTNVNHKKAHTNQTHTHKRTARHAASVAGQAYGYAAEPRRIDPNPFFFGR